MSDGLSFRAGTRARRHLGEFGFRRDDFTSLVGASGGPKWLVLGATDRVLHEHLLRDRQAPIHLLGSSIGAWRHACFAQADPLAALDRFEESYTAQVYETKPTAAEVALESARILAALLGDCGGAEIVANPLIRIHVATVRSAFRWRPRSACRCFLAWVVLRSPMPYHARRWPRFSPA
ncbi:MAG: hypothetical protein ABGY42_16830 [bacterium]